MAKTQGSELNRYIKKIIAINQIEKKKVCQSVNDIPINNCALRARYGVSNRIESKNISINRKDKISYQ